MDDLTPTRPMPRYRRAVLEGADSDRETAIGNGEDAFEALTALFLGPSSGNGSGPSEDKGRDRSGDVSGMASEVASAGASGGGDEGAAGGAEGDEEPIERTGRARAEGEIEVLLLANLPVLASAWARQYIRDAARVTPGGVGVVRSAGGGCMVGGGEFYGRVVVEVVRGGESQRAAGARADAAERWIVWLDGAGEGLIVDGGFDQEDLRGEAGESRATVLCTVDPVSLVSAYRTIKRITTARAASSAANPGVLRLRLVVVGAPSDVAVRAGDRVASAAAAFLGYAVEVCAGPRKIDGAQATRSEVVAGPMGLREAMAVVRRGGELPGVTGGSGGADAGWSEVDEALLAGELDGPACGLVGDVPAVALSSRAMRDGTVEREPDQGESVSASGLCGLRAIRARCPAAREVELAVDESGGCHMVAQGLDADGRHRGVYQLEVARVWARRNVDLLVAATGYGAGPGSGWSEPTRHLITSDVTSVVDLLGGEVRVHLVTAGRALPGGRVAVCVG